MEAAIDAVEGAFRKRDDETPPRQHVPFGDGEMLFMPASSPRAAGVKLVTINPANRDRGLPLINGVYLLFERGSLEPAAIVDAVALTGIRTAAVSAVATRALALPDAGHLVIFGAGAQAHAHLEAMVAVRPISHVAVVSRSPDKARRLADRARDLVGDGRIETADAVAEADIVCTCTTSPTPVFDGAKIQPGVHINAVGSYKKDARELDSEAISRATTIAVETRPVMGESGDLAIPLDQGELDPAAIKELAEVLDGPRDPGAITIFKSVGQAFEDLAVAELLLDSVRGA